MSERSPMYDKPIKQVVIDAVNLYFRPLRDPRYRPVFVLIVFVSAVMAIIEVYKPFD